MNKMLEQMLRNWKWDQKTIDAMKNSPDLKEVQAWKEKVYEETKDMTPEERIRYFSSSRHCSEYKS